MNDTVATAGYLSIMAGVVSVLLHKEISANRVSELRKTVSWLIAGHALALTWIFIRVYAGRDVFVYAAALSFCPVIWLATTYLINRRYEGSLCLLAGAMVLSSIGIVTLYRLGLTTEGILARLLLHPKGIHAALSHSIYTVAGIGLTTFLLGSGWMGKILTMIEKRGSIVALGILTFGLLLLPIVMKKLGIGSSSGETSSWVVGKSGQMSQVGLTIMYPLFASKYLSQRSYMLNSYSDSAYVFRSVLLLTALIGVVFFFPMMALQKELGVPLLIAMVTVSVVSVISGRAYYFVIGIFLIAATLALGTHFSPHVYSRIVQGWWKWHENISGKGYQLFVSLAGARNSNIWGTGLEKRYHQQPPHVTNDFIASPILEGGGLILLLVVMCCFMLFIWSLRKVQIERDFRGILMVSICVVIVVQAFYNISFVLGKVPMTGVPISFLSNGGSSILCGYFLVAMQTELMRRAGPKGGN